MPGPHPTPAPAPAPADPRVRQLDALGRLLDDSIPIPGTGRRIGVDALIGLVPGFGDAAGALLSAYIVAQAARLGVSRATLLRMAGNVGVEAIVGTIPLLGDLFDAGFKANLRNLRLLHAHLQQPADVRRASRRWAWGTLAALLLLLAGFGALGVWIAAAAFQALSGG